MADVETYVRPEDSKKCRKGYTYLKATGQCVRTEILNKLKGKNMSKEQIKALGYGGNTTKALLVKAGYMAGKPGATKGFSMKRSQQARQRWNDKTAAEKMNQLAIMKAGKVKKAWGGVSQDS